MDDTQTWAAIDRYRAWFAETAMTLTAEQWATPSACSAWTVRELAAHLTMPLLSKPQLGALALRHLGPTNRLIERTGRALSERYDDVELIDRLGRLVGHRGLYPGMGNLDVLLEAITHGLDLARPLGIAMPHDPADVAAAADRFISYGRGSKAKVFADLTWRDHRLVATDHDWAIGDGAVVEAPMVEHLLLLTGRRSSGRSSSPR